MFKAKFIKKYIGILLLIAAALLMFWLFSEEVADEITASRSGLPRATVLALSPQKISVPMVSHGNISARWRSVLTSDIAGKVIYVSPKLFVGGEFNQGDVLLRLDDARYRVELAEARSALATAEQHYYQERQQAKRAAQDWQASGFSGEADDLLLRKPQVAAAELQVKAAKIAVKRARQNLDDVNIKAPYAGATISRRISLGDYLAPEAEIAEIYAYQGLQVHLTLQPSQLSLLSHDSTVVLHDVDSQKQWQAKITRHSKVVEPKSRMVEVIAELEDSLAPDSLPLLGQFVQAELSGPVREAVLQVPQNCISGDSHIWMVDADSRLQLFEHTYLSEHREHVYLQPLTQASSNSFHIVCYPSKAFYAGMSVAMQLKHDE